MEEDDADRQAQRHHTSRVQSSMNWKQPIPAAVTTDGKADITMTSASPNYRGDPTVTSNQSAVIPDSKNTSLWVTGLPRECASYSDLMDLLKGRGRIFATSINDAPSRFRTAAAAVTFFRHIDAENVMRAMNDGTLRVPLVSQATTRRSTRHAGGLIISAPSDDQDDMLVVPEGEKPALIDVETAETTGRPKSPSNQQSDGVKVHAIWNRVRVAERELRRGHLREHRQYHGPPQLPSRVIRVRGLAEYVKPAALEVYFNSRFRYDLDRVIYRGTTKHGLEEYEYRFACWKNQVPIFSPFHLTVNVFPLAYMLMYRPMRISAFEAWACVLSLDCVIGL